MTGEKTMNETVKQLPKKAAIGLIKFYQNYVSPCFPPHCRFIPTCSQYALEAFQKYGFLKGFMLSFKRIMKCHPGGPYGFDPVP